MCTFSSSSEILFCDEEICSLREVISASLEASFFFRDSISAEAAVLEVEPAIDGREACLAAVAVPADDEGAVERRFLASAVAPLAAGFAAAGLVALPVVPVVVEVREVVVGVVLVADVEDVAGLRAGAAAAPVLDVVFFSTGLAGEGGTAEVRRAVAVAVELVVDRFFSSSEAEGWERCEVAVEDEVVGRLAVVLLVDGRAGGLLRLEPEGAAARVTVELEAGLAADDEVPVAGRRAAVVVVPEPVPTVEVRFAGAEALVEGLAAWAEAGALAWVGEAAFGAGALA